MKVMGLDGREYPWNITGCRVNVNDTRPRSSYHLAARSLLSNMFPCMPILEEVLLPGTRNLRLDFYLPSQHTAIEVQGPQHYEHVSYFHGGKKGYDEAMIRDQNKLEWCQINNIRLVHLRYSDGEDEWKRQITG